MASADITPAQPKDATGVLLLADGTALWGKGFGATGSAVGEVCFNTAMTGYQEVMTDPSYAAQIVTFTFPHIGNVGSNDEDVESAVEAAVGCVVREEVTPSSNFRADKHFDEWMSANGKIGLSGIDTRALTRFIRLSGAPNAVIAHAPDGTFDLPALLARAQKWPGLEGMDLAQRVSRAKQEDWGGGPWALGKGYGRAPWPKSPSLLQGRGRSDEVAEGVGDARDASPASHHPPTPSSEEEGEFMPHVVAIDYGAKDNIFRNLVKAGARVTVVPAKASLEEVLAHNPDGVFLSNGPGDPAATGEYAVPVIAGLLERDIPLFGICLGHQMLALAAGAKTTKMHQGHRGANHPVQRVGEGWGETSGLVEITSMNHGFAVDGETLPEGVEQTHVSLFDGSNCGISIRGKKAFGVQYHPEASPGPQDSFYLFEKFVGMLG
ncbi:glutamine-hydrolyzing carbamoyl-phosphate synthase small subunit [Erythrobacter litoralis]|uniref:Carbamoyl phosphate synthase small chain n=1 Tax=Erythrobacter litoralis (strain HTCC2594) TaxID=314225 RepID=Q2NAR2_ERYLH|nr:glutamine-hydrolyzing carbamoyl-phosphate synthase small subunit [Erythrobacter litoralis]ABC63229.1 carbamoyl-phosphate synthase small chain [Erythrobacter litoralis HTCC2594]